MKPGMKMRGQLLGVIFILTTGASGCGARLCTDFGKINLTVTVPSEVTVASAAYAIAGNDIKVILGNVPISAGSGTQLIQKVPVGNGYVLSVSGKSTDGKLTCQGESVVNVKVEQTTSVTIPLFCHSIAGDTGTVSIVVGIKCPGVQLTSYTVSPLSVSVGGMIDVSAVAADKTDGGVLTYVWEASSGKFANPMAANTSFTCEKPGTANLVVTVSNGSCVDTGSMVVMCVPVDGGGV